MRILLINPPQPYMIEKHTQAPLGLLYLSSAIKNIGLDEVIVKDFSTNSIKEAIKIIQKEAPWDICGFTATTLDYLTTLKMMRLLKIQMKKTFFIIGGPHVTPCSIKVSEDGWDAVFEGESDLTILDFLDDIRKKQKKKFIKLNE